MGWCDVRLFRLARCLIKLDGGAGVTIQAPQLDINTVAAGGGSRLFFRMGVFQVGPESAGAHPGPVCYRRALCSVLFAFSHPTSWPRCGSNGRCRFRVSLLVCVRKNRLFITPFLGHLVVRTVSVVFESALLCVCVRSVFL
jgi:Hydantoinase/oxoprolinase